MIYFGSSGKRPEKEITRTADLVIGIKFRCSTCSGREGGQEIKVSIIVSIEGLVAIKSSDVYVCVCACVSVCVGERERGGGGGGKQFCDLFIIFCFACLFLVSF